MEQASRFRVVNPQNNPSQNNHSCRPCEFSRRAFLEKALQIMAAGAGVALLGGCGESGTSAGGAPVAGSTAAPVAAIPVGNDFQIAGGGKLAPGAALVFVLPDQSKGIVFLTKSGHLGALSAKCTHAGCIVEWQANQDQLHCPCHGSRFDAAGKVLNGPATRPLSAFKARRQDEDALISTT
jgi:cytochrome b6-f complex iron-sulfur subunit